MPTANSAAIAGDLLGTWLSMNRLGGPDSTIESIPGITFRTLSSTGCGAASSSLFDCVEFRLTRSGVTCASHASRVRLAFAPFEAMYPLARHTSERLVVVDNAKRGERHSAMSVGTRLP
jgi:hypothetical protein